jgi:hypothetical protein
MKRSGFIAIGSSATRSHHSFSMGSCALPSLFLLVLSRFFAAGQVRPSAGVRLLCRRGATATAAGMLPVTGRVARPTLPQMPASWTAGSTLVIDP